MRFIQALGLFIVTMNAVAVQVERSAVLDKNTTEVDHSISKRSASAPTAECNSGSEGTSVYNPLQTDTVWICKSGKWTPFKLTLSLGMSEDFPASSCQEILQSLTANCYQPPTDGMYWIKLKDQCEHGEQEQVLKIWCDMTTSNGGWSLVWKHSYLEVSPLTTDMYYFSTHYRPCTDINSGWCNIPYKARFNPSEMMIVAYHNKRVVYAYKGKFNRNIDFDWTGGILLDPVKCVDYCKNKNTVPPEPSYEGGDKRLLGLAFGKWISGHYHAYSDTIYNSFGSSNDNRFAYCHVPSHISSSLARIQMTLAISVR